MFTDLTEQRRVEIEKPRVFLLRRRKHGEEHCCRLGIHPGYKSVGPGNGFDSYPTMIGAPEQPLSKDILSTRPIDAKFGWFYINKRSPVNLVNPNFNELVDQVEAHAIGEKDEGIALLKSVGYQNLTHIMVSTSKSHRPQYFPLGNKKNQVMVGALQDRYKGHGAVLHNMQKKGPFGNGWNSARSHCSNTVRFEIRIVCNKRAFDFFDTTPATGVTTDHTNNFDSYPYSEVPEYQNIFPNAEFFEDVWALFKKELMCTEWISVPWSDYIHRAEAAQIAIERVNILHRRYSTKIHPESDEMLMVAMSESMLGIGAQYLKACFERAGRYDGFFWEDSVDGKANYEEWIRTNKERAYKAGFAWAKKRQKELTYHLGGWSGPPKGEYGEGYFKAHFDLGANKFQMEYDKGTKTCQPDAEEVWNTPHNDFFRGSQNALRFTADIWDFLSPEEKALPAANKQSFMYMMHYLSIGTRLGGKDRQFTMFHARKKAAGCPVAGVKLQTEVLLVFKYVWLAFKADWVLHCASRPFARTNLQDADPKNERGFDPWAIPSDLDPCAPSKSVEEEPLNLEDHELVVRNMEDHEGEEDGENEEGRPLKHRRTKRQSSTQSEEASSRASKEASSRASKEASSRASREASSKASKEASSNADEDSRKANDLVRHVKKTACNVVDSLAQPRKSKRERGDQVEQLHIMNVKCDGRCAIRSILQGLEFFHHLRGGAWTWPPGLAPPDQVEVCKGSDPDTIRYLRHVRIEATENLSRLYQAMPCAQVEEEFDKDAVDVAILDSQHCDSFADWYKTMCLDDEGLHHWQGWREGPFQLLLLALARLLKIDLHVSYVQARDNGTKALEGRVHLHAVDGAELDDNIPKLNLAMMLSVEGSPWHFDLGLTKSLSQFKGTEVCNAIVAKLPVPNK